MALIAMDLSMKVPIVNGRQLVFIAKSVFIYTETEEKDLSKIEVLPNIALSLSHIVKTFVKPQEIIGIEGKSNIVSNSLEHLFVGTSLKNIARKELKGLLQNRSRDILVSTVLITQNDRRQEMVTTKPKIVERCRTEMLEGRFA